MTLHKKIFLINLLPILLISLNLRAPITSVGPVVDLIKDYYHLSAAQAGLLTSLPLFALYQGIERLSDYIIILKEESYYNREDIFREFFNKLFFVFNELLADFAEIFPEKIETGILSEQVLLKIHYDGKEEIDFSKYI